jgi:hypothetical protein
MVDWPPVRNAAPTAPHTPSPSVAPPAPPLPVDTATAPEPALEVDGTTAAATPEPDATASGAAIEAIAEDPAEPAGPAPAGVAPAVNERAASGDMPSPEPQPEPEPSDLPSVATSGEHGRGTGTAGASAEAEPALIHLPPGIEVVATDGAIRLDAARLSDTRQSDDVRIDPVLEVEPPVDAPAPVAESPAPLAPSPTADAIPRTGEPATAAPSTTEPAPSFVLQADRAARWRRPGVRLALGLASLVAAFGLVAQATHAYRDRIAAASPALRPWLQQACAALGCRVGEYRQIDALSVESSGLVRVEGAPVYRLAVTLRNRAPLEVAAPAIDLALTDAQGQQIARRVLTMADLDLPLRSLKPGSELPIQAPLRIDGQVSGYTVEIFYP